MSFFEFQTENQSIVPTAETYYALLDNLMNDQQGSGTLFAYSSFFLFMINYELLYLLKKKEYIIPLCQEIIEKGFYNAEIVARGIQFLIYVIFLKQKKKKKKKK